MIELIVFIFLMFVYIKPFKGLIPLSDNEYKMLSFLLNNKKETAELLKTKIESKETKSSDLLDIDTLNMFGEDKEDYFDVNIKDIMNMKK